MGLGHEPNITYGTLHYGNPHKYIGSSYTLGEGNFNNEFHVFALEWLPGEIRWYVDDVLYSTQKDWYSNPELLYENITYPAPFDRDFYLQLNLAVGGDWPGNPNKSTTFPQKIEIDWIRVYKSENGYNRPKPPKKSVSKQVHGRKPKADGNYVYNSTFNENMEN